jgi:pimeloyl-ACP methyl ester carboxylesterase
MNGVVAPLSFCGYRPLPSTDFTWRAMAAETELAGCEHASSNVSESDRDATSIASDDCPSPLGWAQVLEAFNAQSKPWTIDRNGVALAGRTFGQGRPLYFLNGISGTSELFCLLAWLLRDEFRCVLFDYPETSWFRRGPTAERLVDQLIAVADSQRDETFSLFATSFGSVVALEALAAHPERIGRAILQGGFAHRQLSAFERLLVRAGALLPGRVANIPFREAIHRANHERYFPPFDVGRWSFFVKDAGRTRIRDLAARGAIVRSFDFRRRLPQISRPVMLIHSENEGLVSAGCHEELERGLPNAVTEFLHSTGHLSYLTHPHRLAKLVRQYCGSETV